MERKNHLSFLKFAAQEFHPSSSSVWFLPAAGEDPVLTITLQFLSVILDIV